LAAAILASLVLFWGALLLGGCGNGAADSVGNDAELRPRIVATTGMVGDLVRALVGQDAVVETIMGPGVDPHLYQPLRGDAIKTRAADVVVYNGLHLEGRLGEVLASRADSGATTIAVAETLPEQQLMAADAGLYDPHIWMDVSLWKAATAQVAAVLAQAMPQHAEAVTQRAAEYQQRLEELDRWGQATLDSIPPSQRVLITAHDAFRYFGRRYGIEVHGVQGVSTISDAAVGDLNRLVKLITERNVPAVFFESSVSGRQVEAIVEGARSRGHEVSSDWQLLSDSMGASGTPQGTYVGMMQHNFSTIATALGGTPAEVLP